MHLHNNTAGARDQIAEIPITWQPTEPNVRRYGVEVSEDNQMKVGQSFKFVPLSTTLTH